MKNKLTHKEFRSLAAEFGAHRIGKYLEDKTRRLVSWAVFPFLNDKGIRISYSEGVLRNSIHSIFDISNHDTRKRGLVHPTIETADEDITKVKQFLAELTKQYGV